MNRVLIVLLCGFILTSASAQVLEISGEAFLLDGKPFDMWGVRMASASQTEKSAADLISSLDDYKSSGINCISVFLQGSSGGFTDPFGAGGTRIDQLHWKRMTRIIEECFNRGMVVIVGIFYQRTMKDPEICNLRSEKDIRNAVRLVAEKLKPYRNVIINIANEQNSAHYRSYKAFAFNDPENIISLCEEVKLADPERIVGGGGYHDSANVVIGKSSHVDVLLFDTYSVDIENGHHSGWHYDYFKSAGVPDKPIVNVEIFGGWTRQFIPQGIYTPEGKAIHYTEIAAAKKRPGLYVHLHSNPWYQGRAQNWENRFDLGGNGSPGDPGVRWYFDAITRDIGSGKPGPELIFQSGFEPDSKVVTRGEGVITIHSDADIVGADQSLSPPNDWVKDLDDHPDIGNFQLQYQGGDSSMRFARIIPEPGNPDNHVLHFWLNEPNVRGKKGRIQANIYRGNGMKEFYQSTRIFLHDDFNTVRTYPDKIHWLTIAEYWNNITWDQSVPHGFRITLGTGKPVDGEGDLYFILDAQDCQLFENGRQKYTTLWAEVNRNIKVPIGEWFTLEYYYKEGNEKTGRYHLAILTEDGHKEVVFDLNRITHNSGDPAPDGVSDFNPLKLYTSKSLIDYMKSRGKTLQIYWDDFKLWQDKEHDQ
jgi:hypothetical protein